MSYLHGVEIKEIQQKDVAITEVATSIIGIVGIADKGPSTPVLISSLPQAEKEFGKKLNGIYGAINTIYENGGALIVAVRVSSTTNSIIAGIKKLELSESTLGVTPKIIFTPDITAAGHLTQLVSTAEKLKAIAIHSINGTSVTNLIAAKTAINVSSDRLLVSGPSVIKTNSVGQTVNLTMAQFVAAAIAKRDKRDGYWHSPSNMPINGITKTTIPITASIHDTSADTNLLNAQGIITVFRKSGTGYRIWGNWTSVYPTNKNMTAMIAPRRITDVLQESVQTASLTFIDKPITGGLIDAIQSSVNSFILLLIGRGAVIDGECTYNKEKNPSTQISQGKLVFDITFVPAPSLERITFESYIDINLL